MSTDKKEIIAVSQYKDKKIATAVNNVIISLKKMGLVNSKVTADENTKTAYIAINVDDVADVLAKNCRKSVKQACGDTVEVVAVSENNHIVIRIRPKE